MTSASLGTLLLLVLLVLTGCSTYPVSPPREDPFKGVLDPAQLKPAASHVITNAKEKRLGIIVSASTEKQLKYKMECLEWYKTKANEGLRGVTAAADPTNLVDRVMLLMKERFKTVELVETTDGLQNGQLDYVALLDFGFREDGVNGVLKILDSADAHFLDANFSRIGVARGSSSAMVNYNACVKLLLIYAYLDKDCAYQNSMNAYLQVTDQVVASFALSLDQIVK